MSLIKIIERKQRFYLKRYTYFVDTFDRKLPVISMIVRIFY